MRRGFPYTCDEDSRPRLGLVVLRADETIERDMRRLIPAEADLLVSRVASGRDLTVESLIAMEVDLVTAATLFPEGMAFDVAAYACTSGTAQIGADRVGRILSDLTSARAVTDPVTALIAACRALGLRRLAILSPYTAAISDRLRETLANAGIETPVFGSFDVAREAVVARIDAASITGAALDLAGEADADGLFLSCTNLRTLDCIGPLAARLGRPVLSSNSVLAWHMRRLAGGLEGWDDPGAVPGNRRA